MPVPLALIALATGGVGFVGTFWYYYNRGYNSSPPEHEESLKTQFKMTQVRIFEATNAVASLSPGIKSVVDAVVNAAVDNTNSSNQIKDASSELLQTQNKLMEALDKVEIANEQLALFQQAFQDLTKQMHIKEQENIKQLNELREFLKIKEGALAQASDQVNNLNETIESYIRTQEESKQTIVLLMNKNQEQSQIISEFEEKIKIIEPQMKLMTHQCMFFKQLSLQKMTDKKMKYSDNEQLPSINPN